MNSDLHNRTKEFRGELKELFIRYGDKHFDVFLNEYYELKTKYSLRDRWGAYTDFVEYCIKLQQYKIAIQEWNNLMEEEWEGFDFRWSYHEFHIPYLLRFEFLTKRSVVKGQNVYRMSGWKKLTKFGLENLDEIIRAIDLLIQENGSFFKLLWSNYNFNVNYINSNKLKKDTGINTEMFLQKCFEKAEELGRSAENYFRENSGLPKIGEGWVSETKLYYQIKDVLDVKVIQHGKPKWLGRQHFDIWIPSLNIAIEYQGLQHDKPIEYFGGVEAFEQNQKRDERKKNLCIENGVTLIEVREGYDINQLYNNIIKHKNS